MQVYKGRWNGVLVAIKALNVGDGATEDLFREAAVLEQLRHPHIIKFLGLFSTVDNQAGLLEILMKWRSIKPSSISPFPQRDLSDLLNGDL